jgi:hypothetical protein
MPGVPRPRMFALVGEVDESNPVVGYGIALPDGSAVSVSWPAERGAAYFSSRNAEDNAFLRGADLVWMDA